MSAWPNRVHRSENYFAEFGSHAFSHDSQTLIHCNSEGTITFYDLERGEELLRWRASTKGIRGLAFTPEGDLVCSANRVHPARMLHLVSLRRQLSELGLDW